MRNRKTSANKMRAEAPVNALARWNPALSAVSKDDEKVFNIYSQIGDTWDGTGVTPDKLAAFLEKSAGKDVVVNINSPGGDFFDGLAMHTMLSEYDGGVTVKVVGLAASAASMIAMAGDEIFIAESGLIMIHNAWSCTCGNKNDFRESADILDRFDESMSKLYIKKTGMKAAEILSMMDDETWMDGADAVAKGFATKILGSKEVVEDETKSEYNATLRKLDVTLARAGMPRSDRRELIKEITSKPSAAEPITPSADALTEGLTSLLNTIKTSTQKE